MWQLGGGLQVTHPEQPVLRGAEQIANEHAMSEVSDVLLNLEHALDRARRAHKRVAKLGTERNAELALLDAVRDLEKVRKNLQRDVYHAGDSLRLL